MENYLKKEIEAQQEWISSLILNNGEFIRYRIILPSDINCIIWNMNESTISSSILYHITENVNKSSVTIIVIFLWTHFPVFPHLVYNLYSHIPWSCYVLHSNVDIFFLIFTDKYLTFIHSIDNSLDILCIFYSHPWIHHLKFQNYCSKKFFSLFLSTAINRLACQNFLISSAFKKNSPDSQALLGLRYKYICSGFNSCCGTKSSYAHFAVIYSSWNGNNSNITREEKSPWYSRSWKMRFAAFS
jgi:hypothetical protein